MDTILRRNIFCSTCPPIRLDGEPEPFLFVTAFGDEALHEEAIHHGAIAVMDKPVDMDELRGFINAYLESPTRERRAGLAAR